MTHDHVFLESTETIDLAERCGFCEHARCVLERCRRDKAVGLKRRLGDAEQHRNGFRRFPAFIDDLFVLVLEVEFVDLIAPEQRGVAWIGDFHFTQHLTNDDLDMFVVNLDALEPVNFLHFVDEVFL